MDKYAAPAMPGKKWPPIKFPEGLFPAAVQQLRAKADLTQVEAAAKLGIQPMTLSKWERGAQTPHPMMQEGTVTALRRLAKKPPKT